MGSKHKQTRQLQKDRLEQLLAKRKSSLLEKGIEKQKLTKDKVAEHLQAKINETARAIAAINAREKLLEKAKIKKQQNAEKMKADKSKSKKQKAESAPAEKDKKKEKKKGKKEEKKSDKK